LSSSSSSSSSSFSSSSSSSIDSSSSSSSSSSVSSSSSGSIVQFKSFGLGRDTTDTCVISKPSGLAIDDLMVAQINVFDDGITTPAGWTQIAATEHTSCGMFIYWKIADAADVAASSFDFVLDNGANTHVGCIGAFTGASTINPIPAGDIATGSGTSLSTIGMIQNTSGNMLLIMSNQGDTGAYPTTASNWAVAVTNPTWTQRYNYGMGGLTSHTIGINMASAIRRAATFTGVASSTIGHNGPWVFSILEIASDHMSSSSSSSSSIDSSSSSSIDSSSSSSLSSSSSSSALEEGWAWGEETPTQTTAISWTNWKYQESAVEAPNTGDWGELVVSEFDELVSDVRDTGGTRSKHLQITFDKYNTGSGSGNIYWRGQATSFNQADVSPAWEAYTGGKYKNWRFVQVKVTD